MKRLMFTLSLLLFATGCSTAEEPNTDAQSEAVSETTGESSSESAQEVEESTEEDATEEDLASVPEEEIGTDNVIMDQNEFPEMSLIQETINLENLEGHLVTDNPGTRVVIFVEEGEQAYKSIFIKAKNRLKLVDLRANELVLNEIVSE